MAGGAFAPGHVGELTQILPFEMVDAALAETGTLQSRVRRLPSRVVVYLLVAAALFADVGYGQVWAAMTAGLGDAAPPPPSAGAMAQARRRIGPAPLRALLELLSGPGATSRRKGVYWHELLVTAIDGTSIAVPDTCANLRAFCKGGGHHGGTGYPMIRLLALVACGTRTIIGVTFGTTAVGETTYTRDLIPAMRPGTTVLADRNFAAAWLIEAIAAAGAHVLVRVKDARALPVCARYRDGSYLTRMGALEVRVVAAHVTIATAAGTTTSLYRLVTTVTDPTITAGELIRLYHERWEIETAYLEIKQSIGGGRVLRSRTPAGLEQETYALLVAYQTIRLAITDATLARPDVDPDRASFTIALTTARHQLIAAAGVITDSVDLVGAIGTAVLAHLLPPRRLRVGPRVVKRAISKYVAKTATGRLHAPSYRATLEIAILTAPGP